jgi:phosphoribulokinase
MANKHPIIAVTGSSGAGTTTIKNAFSELFRREGTHAALVTGDAFRRYGRDEMRAAVEESIRAGKPISHFGPDANLFDKLEALFRDYSASGSGESRNYVHNDEEAQRYQRPPGSFTPWETFGEDSDLLFYEGLHGGVVAQTWTRRRMSPSHNPRVIKERRNARNANRGVDVARYVDLLIGVVPVVNLEWIQKIHRDMRVKGRSPEIVTATILRRMQDYIHFIVPQFSLTDINFQRVPLVDTSNPFIARDVPDAAESMLVIRFRDPYKFDMPPMLKRFPNSFMSRPNTMVIPGGQLRHALEVICAPILHKLCSGEGF